MGFFVSAMLTLLAADKTGPAQALQYGRLAEGLVQSRFIHKEMTGAEVKAIVGEPDGMVGSPHHLVAWYYTGIAVQYEWRLEGQIRVIDVEWKRRPYRP